MLTSKQKELLVFINSRLQETGVPGRLLQLVARFHEEFAEHAFARRENVRVLDRLQRTLGVHPQRRWHEDHERGENREQDDRTDRVEPRLAAEPFLQLRDRPPEELERHPLHLGRVV